MAADEFAEISFAREIHQEPEFSGRVGDEMVEQRVAGGVNLRAVDTTEVRHADSEPDPRPEKKKSP